MPRPYPSLTDHEKAAAIYDQMCGLAATVSMQSPLCLEEIMARLSAGIAATSDVDDRIAMRRLRSMVESYHLSMADEPADHAPKPPTLRLVNPVSK